MDDLIYKALETFQNFIVTDEKGVIRYINNRYAKMLGTTKEEAIGQLAIHLIPNTQINRVLTSGEADMGSIMTIYDHTQKCETTVVCNRIPIKENGNIIGVAGVTTFGNIIEAQKLNNDVAAVIKINQEYEHELKLLRMRINAMDGIIGVSAAIKATKESIIDYADSNLPILIIGETGTGKELFARAIHQNSRRTNNNYVKINCAAIPGELLESELFGYEGGAFTGAAKGGKMGKIELAHGGTLLLDEIGEMPMSLQAKLLRVLQEKEIERVGGLKAKSVNFRLICSTNKDLKQLVKEGTFREDLYYRINTVELHIPPLRERIEDIEPLVRFFMEKVNKEYGYHVTDLSDEVLLAFRHYNWEGNVRELEHTVERAIVLCKAGQMQLKHIHFLLDKLNPTDDNSDGFYLKNNVVPSIKKAEDEEADLIIQALKESGGNKAKAARLLGMERTMFYRKLKKHGINI